MVKSHCTLLFLLLISFFFSNLSYGQLKWQNVDSLFQPLPYSVHVYRSTGLLDGKPNIAYYVEADLKDKKLDFTVDTTFQRRLTPSTFYEKNDRPLLVVNTTFFSFATNQNLNVVIKDGKLVGYNIHTINGRGKDTFTYRHPFGSAIGISKKRDADIAWLYTDSSKKFVYGMQLPMNAIKDSTSRLDYKNAIYITSIATHGRAVPTLEKWKMQTAVGGGPVLLQNGQIAVSNNEEMKFAGKAIDDKHPRTAMGYTKNNKLIILVIEGRNPGKAEGATLTQEAQIFKDLGCWEALNLDGGGSSCMLVNGKETIKVSDAAGQRPVPAVFLIKQR
jgi:exopolysaccharide biosynthesis protein